MRVCFLSFLKALLVSGERRWWRMMLLVGGLFLLGSCYRGRVVFVSDPLFEKISPVDPEKFFSKKLFWSRLALDYRSVTALASSEWFRLDGDLPSGIAYILTPLADQILAEASVAPSLVLLSKNAKAKDGKILIQSDRRGAFAEAGRQLGKLLEGDQKAAIFVRNDSDMFHQETQSLIGGFLEKRVFLDPLKIYRVRSNDEGTFFSFLREGLKESPSIVLLAVGRLNMAGIKRVQTAAEEEGILEGLILEGGEELEKIQGLPVLYTIEDDVIGALDQAARLATALSRGESLEAEYAVAAHLKEGEGLLKKSKERH